MSREPFRGIAATTHLDKHGECVSKQLLDQWVADFRESGEPLWSYWNHQTTLPPILLVTKERVEQSDDGEYVLAVEGVILGEDDFEILPQSDLERVQVSSKEVTEVLKATPVRLETLEISYDPRNFNPDEASPIIASIDELIPTTQRMFVRKSEIPQVVVWILVAFATGLVQRVGEVVADRTLESLHRTLNQRISLLLSKSKASEKPDVIFSVTVPNSNTIVEGAVENASKQVLQRVWSSLPELYGFALSLVRKNRKDFFSQMNFLFNPVTNKKLSQNAQSVLTPVPQ